uniref:Retrovirus-related Pol polyprotein from transposon TNT 1-94 n=1 Tax=Cajanus cajan TaxID=3821 RepID=A0A151S4U3_CAJCA|nr:Retrovirus-related Pol polyprotein from transposon TNT 1-94 [Cajanus cajan]
MLLSADISKALWVEVVMTTTYLINRFPLIASNLKIPEQVWFGHTPSLKHLKVSGCDAYAHIKQDKLEPKAVKCIFIG